MNYSKIHYIKIEKDYLDRVKSGQKSFEIRKDDRDYQVGDCIKLMCGDDNTWVEITYKSTYMQQEGYCVLGISIGHKDV